MADCYITELYTYPIKSCGSLSHTTIELDLYGPVWDRRWMIVDEDDLFVTQRELPRMALIQPSFKDGQLSITAPGMNEICVPLEDSQRQTRVVQIWNDTCKAWDEGIEVAAWISDYLHVDLRLVRMTEGFVRRVDERYARQPAQTAFSDGFPILLASEASLDELNRRLIERKAEALPMSRFRPNLVVAGCDAFAEDQWKTIQIGNLLIDVVKPSARCAIPSVDQQTAEIREPKEPLATLNTFRKRDGKVVFAQNAIHHAPGKLAVGDMVTVIA
jgi:uncharacterized protein YcbX